MKILIILMTVLAILTACSSKKKEKIIKKPLPYVEIQGHRGARGLLPENSIIGFKKAMEIGVDVLELDVVITKDKRIVLSHESYISPEICLYPDHTFIPNSHEKKNNIYKMNYDEIKRFDCGLKLHPRFLTQEKVPAIKPLLSDVIDEVNLINDQVRFNIETKSTILGDNKEHPIPKVFVSLLYQLLKKKNILDRVIIQSFDPRTLNELHKIDPLVKTALLVENTESVDANLKALNFIPTIYSPEFILLNPETIHYLHSKKIQVIPWTLNKPEDMIRLVMMGVDGIITDYPDIAIKTLRGK